MSRKIKIFKFGGTSVSHVDALETIAEVAMAQQGPCMLVVSALKGVTDRLVAMTEAPHCEASIQALYQQHSRLIDKILPPDQALPLCDRTKQLTVELAELLCKNPLPYAKPVMDQILSFGERMSSEIVAAFLTAKGLNACLIDARSLVITDDCFGEAAALREASRGRLDECIAGLDANRVIVTQGFIGATETGQTTTMGRGGSDITATFLADLAHAEEVQIWTDVHGMLAADPQIVPQARSIECLTHNEASLLAHFGAHVLHPRTIDHLRDRSIAMRVKNTYAPNHPGTLISDGGTKPFFAIAGTQSTLFFRNQGDAVTWHPKRGVNLPGNDPVAVILDELVAILETMPAHDCSLICIMARGFGEGDPIATAISGTNHVIASRGFTLDHSRGLVLFVAKDRRTALIAALYEALTRQLWQSCS